MIADNHILLIEDQQAEHRLADFFIQLFASNYLS